MLFHVTQHAFEQIGYERLQCYENKHCVIESSLNGTGQVHSPPLSTNKIKGSSSNSLQKKEPETKLVRWDEDR